MKQVLIPVGIFLLTSVSSAALLPMNFAEKSSYQLTALVKKGTVDKSFLIDLNKVTLQTSQQGAVVLLSSPSLNAQDPNTITINFDASGKVADATTHFTAADPQKAVFNKANADVILDLGSEAVVDHQKDSPDIAFSAAHAKEISFSQDGKINMNIKLDDGRTYTVIMDLDGNVLSRKMN